ARRPLLDHRAFLVCVPNGLHDDRAVAPATDDLGQQLRRVLSVGIHRDDGPAPRLAQTREQPPLMAETPRETASADLAACGGAKGGARRSPRTWRYVLRR